MGLKCLRSLASGILGTETTAPWRMKFWDIFCVVPQQL